MTKYVIVNQTVSKRWPVPEGKTPEAFLDEVLEYGFDDMPVSVANVNEEYFLMDENGNLSPLDQDDDDDELVRCLDCGWEGEAFACKAIKHLTQRVATGEPMPVGECPECGALCYPVEE